MRLLPASPLLALLALPLASQPGSTPDRAERSPARFRDVAARVGLGHLQRRPTQECLFFAPGAGCQMELMSGGYAVGDVNADGWPDVYMTSLGRPDALFLNLGGSFVEVAAQAGLTDVLQSNGARFVDVDNDGDPDLVVTVLGEAGDALNNRHRLYVNHGPAGFREEGLSRGFEAAIGGLNGWSIAAGDYDRDGWIDLYLCGWRPEVGSRSVLLRNRGAEAPGHFEDTTSAAGLDGIGMYAFGASFVDLDQDGWQDLAIAGDFLNSRLLWNEGDGTFVDGTLAAGVGTDENGMGSALADVDGDGDLDWFVTSIFEEIPACFDGGCTWSSSGNRMYINQGDRSFVDATDAWGVRNSDWGWGATFLDLENDGDLDLAATNGVWFPEPEALAFHTDRTRVWVQGGQGPLREQALELGLVDQRSGKGLGAIDYDLDGDQDLLLTRNSDRPALFENGGPTGAWLQVAVEGRLSNRDGLGAIVRVTPRPGDPPLVQEVGVDTHFLAQGDLALHFGLGRPLDTVWSVEVSFPASGIVRRARNVRPNHRMRVRE